MNNSVEEPVVFSSSDSGKGAGFHTTVLGTCVNVWLLWPLLTLSVVASLGAPKSTVRS